MFDGFVQRNPAEVYEIDSNLVRFLRDCGAYAAPHGGRSLAEHLMGTCALLHQWGNQDEVCKAGLFHSVYGTEAYTRITHCERDMLRSIIGGSAELLVHLFSVCPRDKILGEPKPFLSCRCADGREIEIALSEWKELVEIHCANTYEQLPSLLQVADIRVISMKIMQFVPWADLLSRRAGEAIRMLS